MSDGPAVSVVIPVYNGEKHIREALESVFKQTYQDYEVVCVDDGSTDSSHEIIKGYGKRVVCCKQENAGPSSARNKAIRMSRGEFVAFLDQDDVWYPDKLEQQVGYLKRNPDVAMVHSNINISMDDKVVHNGLEIGKRQYGSNVFEELCLGNFINSITVVIRRTVLDKIGHFDEAFRMAQDYDLWLRVAAEYKIAFQDEIMGEYRLHDNNSSRGNIEVVKDDLKILNKIRSMYPTLVSDIPEIKIRDRYYQKYYMLGYGYFCQYDLNNARRYFLKSLRIKKTSMRALMYVLSTFFRKETINRMRSIKGKMNYSIT
ncbi:glycosyltransferase [Candidatus Moduliflexota bacterium]